MQSGPDETEKWLCGFFCFFLFFFLPLYLEIPACSHETEMAWTILPEGLPGPWGLAVCLIFNI